MKHQLIIPEPVPTMCDGQDDCSCPMVLDARACNIARLVNSFVTESQPVVLEMDDKTYTAILAYFALASLRRR